MASANGRVELADLRDGGGRRLLFDMREARENYAQGWGSSSGSRWGMRPADLLAALAVPPGGATGVEHGTGGTTAAGRASRSRRGSTSG